MRSWLCGLAIVVVCVAPSLASAQSRADLAAARGFFRDGVAAGEEGRWDDALELFERAHTLSGRADVLLNVAAAQVELDRPAEAAATYRRFQVEADPAMRAQHGDAVRAALAELEEDVPPEDRAEGPPVVEPSVSTVAPIAERPILVDPAIVASPPPRRDDPTLAIVLGVIGGVLVVGGAITLGVVLSMPPGDAPSYQGTVYPYSIDVR